MPIKTGESNRLIVIITAVDFFITRKDYTTLILLQSKETGEKGTLDVDVGLALNLPYYAASGGVGLITIGACSITLGVGIITLELRL